jgi:glycosyltransferase involved in cell wall biosynthesis
MSGIPIAIVHGYFLGDSGSAIYVRELAREFARQGHDVTLVCQQDPGQYDFIDSFYEFDAGNIEMTASYEGKGTLAGRCRLVRPNLGGRLLTYVAGPFTGYEAVTFQDAEESLIEDYVTRNTRALKAVFARWPQQFIQANHAVMQPFVVREAVAGKVPYIVTIHGSALNFSVRNDPRMDEYALAGLSGAAAIGTLSKTSREEVIEYASAKDLNIKDRVHLLPPGVDAGIMVPLEDRTATLKKISPMIDPLRDDIAVFVGRLLWTKGIQYAVAALPLILEDRPNMQYIIVGEGPMEKPLRKMIELIDQGRIEEARSLTLDAPELCGSDEYGQVMPELNGDEETLYAATAKGNFSKRIHFTGHLDHARLAPVYGAADISLATSIYPEAFALVSIEALAAGALPVATYQSGLRSVIDVVAGELDDGTLGRLVPGEQLTTGLAAAVPSMLERFPTRDIKFRYQLHDMAERLFSWSKVAASYLQLASNALPQEYPDEE